MNHEGCVLVWTICGGSETNLKFELGSSVAMLFGLLSKRGVQDGVIE